MQNEFVNAIQQGETRAIARFLSMVENESANYKEILSALHFSNVPVIGITGPPGAGKSTLISCLVALLLAQNKRVAIVAVDPSSPFNHGALMGDRLRMSAHFLHPNLFIRSMATRGSLGGLAPKIFEVVDVLRAALFDYIIIETVGVGQSEVEIAGLANTCVLVLVPEAGDEIQTIKSGIMEIADIFVVNKSDRAGADVFYKNLSNLAHEHTTDIWEAPVIKTVASQQRGLDELIEAIQKHNLIPANTSKKMQLLVQRTMLMIKKLRTRDIDITALEADLQMKMDEAGFNLYTYIEKYK